MVCLSGLMDKVADSGSADAGSIPAWDANKGFSCDFRLRLFLFAL